MKKQLQILFLLITCIACKANWKNNYSATVKSALSDSLLIKIDSYLNSYVNSGFSGVALIADKNGIIFHKAYRAKEDNIDTSTAFYIASNSKPFTAAAILQLQEQGKLSVKDSIGKYFDGVPPEKRGITIHHLLTHTGGLDYCQCTDGATNKLATIQAILVKNLKNDIGAKWSYQNENYYLLGFIIEKVSGLSYIDYINTKIIKPLNMAYTGFWGHEKDIPVTIVPLNDSIKAYPIYQNKFSNGLPKIDSVMPPGIFSTTGDLYKWTLALQRREILSDSSISASFRYYRNAFIRNTNDTIISYGYGWIPTMVNNRRINVFHGGREDWMMNNRIYILDNGFTIIVWAMDKFGPEHEAMASLLTKELVLALEKIKS